MLITIAQKADRKGIKVDDRFFSFQGMNQGRVYVNMQGKTVSLNPAITDHEVGTVLELDDYKSTRQNKTTTEHGVRQPRKAKTPYVATDYLDEDDAKSFAQLENDIESTKEKLEALTVSYRQLVEKSANNYKAQQDAIKAQKQADQKAKQEAQKQKDLAKFQELAKKLGITIA